MAIMYAPFPAEHATQSFLAPTLETIGPLVPAAFVGLTALVVVASLAIAKKWVTATLAAGIGIVIVGVFAAFPWIAWTALLASGVLVYVDDRFGIWTRRALVG